MNTEDRRGLIKELKNISNTKTGHDKIQALRADNKLTNIELKEIYTLDDSSGMIEKVNKLDIEK